MTSNRSSLVRTLALTAAICAIGFDTVASDDSHGAVTTVRSQVADASTPMRKGAMELDVVAGFGISHDLWEGVPDVRFLTWGACLGRVLTAPRGPGFLKGNLEVAGELLPVRFAEPGHTTYGASLALLGRHFFMPRSEWRPYTVLGIGALGTKDRVPFGSSAFNFTLQAGMGVRFAHGTKVPFYVEYRIHHISAGRTTGTGNPGINSSYLEFGVGVLRW